RTSPRPPNAAISTAAVHSRSPVIVAGVTWLNIRPARPAPTWTETMLGRTSVDGGTALMAAVGRRSNRDRVTVTGGSQLLPAEGARGHGDGDHRPNGQDQQVTDGQAPARLAPPPAAL